MTDAEDFFFVDDHRGTKLEEEPDLRKVTGADSRVATLRSKIDQLHEFVRAFALYSDRGCDRRFTTGHSRC